MTAYRNILGVLCVVLGVALILLSVGYLLVRVALAFVGLMLVNHGLRLRSALPLQFMAYRWFSRTRFWG